ncbi:MAG: preprotein translocase subunit YajC [Filifactor alocis]|nr:preprotein translocase subunit YajC [Filifactor alocis]
MRPLEEVFLSYMAVFFLVWYFFGYLPKKNKQKKEEEAKKAKEEESKKQREEMLKGLAAGDVIITSGGVSGIVKEKGDDYIILTVDAAKEVDVRVFLSAVANVVKKA